MVELALRKRSLLGRYLVIPLLVVAVGLLGTAAAVQTVCPPDCDMQKPVASPPSCCERSAMEQEALNTAGHGSHSSGLPQPCCEGKLCLDSSASSPDLTAAQNVIDRDIRPPPNLRGQPPFFQCTSPERPSSEPDVKGPPIPVYLRTCVFLI